MRKLLPIILILSLFGTKVNAQCNAAFTFSVSQATVQFQASNNNSSQLHAWRFGDGGIAYGLSVSHTYTGSGTFTVLQTVTDSLNTCRDSVFQQVVVNVPVNCTAAFTVIQDSNYLNQFYFYATPLLSGGTIQSYSWTLNGTVISTASAFSYNLPVGATTICLSISTTAGCTSSTCQTITITAPPTCSWNASFTHTSSLSNPKQISFHGNPSSYALRYYWNFGDGSTSLLKDPVHTYTQTGNYSVRLAISDTAAGCTDSVDQNVLVQGSPADSCTVSFTHVSNPSQPNVVTFTAESNQTTISQIWVIVNRNGLDSVVSLNPTYIFTDTGYYYVCLYITTSTGCVNQHCENIYINNTGSRKIATIPSYPNPARSTVGLRLTLTENNRIGIIVYNPSGNIVYSTQKQGVAGLNEIYIPVEQLSTGQYFIDIQYGGQKKRSIFQKF